MKTKSHIGKLLLSNGILICFFVFILNLTITAQNCKYDKNGFKEVSWGHERSAESLGDFKIIRGKALSINEVELIKVPIILFRLEKNKKIYIGSQYSDKKGNFCFGKMKQGKYVLLMGAIVDFDSKEFFLRVNFSNKNTSKFIKAYMQVGN